jgi:hypothetical protein
LSKIPKMEHGTLETGLLKIETPPEARRQRQQMGNKSETWRIKKANLSARFGNVKS